LAQRVRQSRSRGGGQQADEALVSRWLARYSANTQRSYRLDIEEFRATTRKPLADVRQQDIDAFVGELDVSPAIQRRRIAALRSFVGYAHRVGAMRRLIVDLQAPMQERKLPVVSEDQVAHMLEMAQTDREYCVVALAYYGALSAPEQAALRWSDVHIDEQEITIAVYGSRPRMVTLSGFLAPLLHRLRGRAGDNDPVMPSRLMGQLHQTSIRYIVRAVATRSGMPEITIQRLRNSHARHALAHGADIQVVSTTLGHRTTRTTVQHLGPAAQGGRSGLSLPRPRRRKLS
jgi:site-specific recombinase XerD